jgi:integrase/recombinase XerD
MPRTVSVNSVGPGLEPAAGTDQLPREEASRRPAQLVAVRSDQELVAGFLLGYGHRTRAAYLADVRDFRYWRDNVGIELFEVRRVHVEGHARRMEHAGRSRATVARRLATLSGFYRYAIQEGALPHSPVTHVRRPAVARESQTLGLDGEEAVQFLAAAEAASARDHALVCLLTLNGLRVSEACAAEVADLGVERGHRASS